MNGKMTFVDCSAKLKLTIFVNSQAHILGASYRGPLIGQRCFGTWLPRADQGLSNCLVPTENQDSRYLSMAKRSSHLPIIHPLNNLGKVTQ